MQAVVEWTHDAQCAAAETPARLAGPARWVDDHLLGVLFETDEEYDFFAAVAGFRSRFDRPPLFPLRGVPAHMSGPSRMMLEYFGPEIAGWRHLSEIERAIRHITDGPFWTGAELNIGLGIMRTLVRKFGDEHVRLVFNIEG